MKGCLHKRSRLHLLWKEGKGLGEEGLTDMQPLDVTGYATTFSTKKQTYHPLLTAKFSQQLHLIILRQQGKIGRNYWLVSYHLSWSWDRVPQVAVNNFVIN